MFYGVFWGVCFLAGESDCLVVVLGCFLFVVSWPFVSVVVLLFWG